MATLCQNEIKELLNATEFEDRIVITPILDEEKQMGTTTIDLRLGTRFKVDIRTRKPYIDPNDVERPIPTFFDETYKDFGERFLLYPGQLVVATTFEYVRLPNNIIGILSTRSSWNRLGINITSIVQPGYAGVLTLELMNTSTNPIALYPGLRIVQLTLLTLEGYVKSDGMKGYVSNALSKYIASTEPKLSNISSDDDFNTLTNKFRKV